MAEKLKAYGVVKVYVVEGEGEKEGVSWGSGAVVADAACSVDSVVPALPATQQQQQPLRPEEGRGRGGDEEEGPFRAPSSTRREEPATVPSSRARALTQRGGRAAGGRALTLSVCWVGTGKGQSVGRSIGTPLPAAEMRVSFANEG